VIIAFILLQVVIMYTAFFVLRMLAYMSHKLTPGLPAQYQESADKDHEDKAAKHQVTLIEPA
jgi:hypothetical protein